MKKLKRLYVYKRTYEKIKEFSERNKLKFYAPNRRENFPYSLEKYIEHLESLVD